MSGMHPGLLARLRKTLLECGAFASDTEMRTCFVDARIGDQWANLLWALRCYLETQNVSSIDINQLVLNAHLRPPPNLNESDVWDCYVQSICKTSKLMDVNLNDWPGCL